ncbi:ubiquitin carboxyl-terminal hydrolase MINDY-1 [Acipenser oxyrinchus oxyrinchus]|uniref:Ubiquitin carboxyl-terminal hydrolase n=1 Tax=Acipenser oxyrinchus oxyrinchus TaxID=40147 RepID=A0AAD8FSZ5_ACIOX|nr:ubiquitin carboxyl-terminal hydrolase MINDY-1 [Acipenser oxyrinchus oxyrinchus]
MADQCSEAQGVTGDAGKVEYKEGTATEKGQKALQDAAVSEACGDPDTPDVKDPKPVESSSRDGEEADSRPSRPGEVEGLGLQPASEVLGDGNRSSQSAGPGSVSVPSPDQYESQDARSGSEPASSCCGLSSKDGECVDKGASSASAPVGSALAAAASCSAADPMPAYYFVKWISWKGKKTPIVTQSENGPCPLLAIMNILFLRWKAKLPAQTEVISAEELMAHLGECVLAAKPREKAKGLELNFQQNLSDAVAVLPKLSTGLDVNVRFTGVEDFEYTPECIVFDLLDIPLYHGWLVDPQSPETVQAVGKLSYNQLVEKIITFKHSADSSVVSEGLLAEQFLESTATQLSYHGLCELGATAKEGELSVFFRNNHFSTMIKHKEHLYLLVSDQGFLQEEAVVWESLHNLEGDGNFCDSQFRLCHPPERAAPAPAPSELSLPTGAQGSGQQRQIDQDYMVAMALQQHHGTPLSDLDLAKQLQEEEYQQQQQPPPQPSSQQLRAQAPARQGAERRRPEKKESSECAIL